MQYKKLEIEVKRHSWLVDVHLGRAGAHWGWLHLRSRTRKELCEVRHRLILRNHSPSTNYFRTLFVHVWEIHYNLSPLTNIDTTVLP